MAAHAKKLDWAAIRADYEAGILSLRAIGKKHGCSDVTILKRSRSEGWTRNLKDRIRAKAEEKVSRAIVSANSSKPSSANEQATIEANATMQAGIILAHRSDIQRCREICRGLIEELGLKSMTEDQRNGILALIADVAKADGHNKKEVKTLIDTFFKSLDLGGRAQTMQRLAGSLETLVKLERVAFGISDEEKPVDAYENALRELRALASG